MGITNLQVWADTLEEIRLPQLTGEVLSIEADLSQSNQQTSDTLATYLALINASTSSATSAVTTVNDALPTIYSGDLNTKFYVDQKIQALRDELTSLLGGLQGYVQGDLVTGLDTQISDQIATIMTQVNESIAAVDAVHAQVTADITELNTVSGQLLNTMIPGFVTQLDTVQEGINSLSGELDVMLSGFTYENLAAAVAAMETNIAGSIAPIGVTIPQAPFSAWTTDNMLTTTRVRTPAPSSWFVQDTILGGSSALLTLGSNISLGQSAPVDFSPTRVYRARARLRVVNQGSFGGVKITLGIATWNNNTIAQSIQKTLRTGMFTSADGIIDIECVFSANLDMLNKNAYLVGTAADKNAVHLSTSSAANKAYFYVRQNASGATVSNGQIAVSLFEVKDITDALNAAEIVRTQTTAQYQDALAAVDQLNTAITGPGGAIASLRTELMASIETGVDANILSQYYTSAQTNNAITSAVNSMRSTIEGPTGTIRSLLDTTYYTRAQADSAISTATTNMQSTINNSINATLTTTYYTKAQTDSAISSLNTTLTSAINRSRTYRQAAAPTSGMVAGDLWFDSDDSNRAYRYTGTSWQATDDTRVGSLTATVSQHSTTIASLDAGLRAVIGFKAQAGNVVSLLDLYAYDGTAAGNESYSIARLKAEQILLDGTVHGSLIAASSIRTNHFSIGMDANYVFDSMFSYGTKAWKFGSNGDAGDATTLSMRARGLTWATLSSETLMLYQNTNDAVGSAFAFNVSLLPTGGWSHAVMPCSPGDILEATAYLSTHRCKGWVFIRWLDSAGTVVTATYLGSSENDLGSSVNPDAWTRVGGRVTVPTNVAYAQIGFRKDGTLAGYTSSCMFIHKPMLTPVSDKVAGYQFTPYVAGHGTTIDGGAIITRTLRGDQLIAGTIDAASGVIGDLAVDTLQIAGNAVTVPTSVFSASLLSIPTVQEQYNVVQSLSYTSTGARVLIFFGFSFYGTGTTDSDFITIRVRRGTTTLYSATCSLLSDIPISGSLMDADASAGSRTYTLEIAINTSVSSLGIRNRTLTAVEIKR